MDKINWKLEIFLQVKIRFLMIYILSTEISYFLSTVFSNWFIRVPFVNKYTEFWENHLRVKNIKIDILAYSNGKLNDNSIWSSFKIQKNNVFKAGDLEKLIFKKNT